ncbi:MAG: hypothetical protein RIC29_02575 [Rhodospirillaceae bacterium]
MKKQSVRIMGALLSFALLSAAEAKDTSDDPYALQEVSGSRLQEFVVSVSDIDLILPAFTDVFKWSVKHDGQIDPTVIRLWGLPFGTTGREVLVGNAASQFGYVRLVDLDVPVQVLMRPGGRWWDTGGLFNLNLLVKDLDATEAGLRAIGWTAPGVQSTYARGEDVRGKSQIMIGPDDLVISFQERQAPPLSGWPEFDGATHIETGYQIVSDLEAWYSFYADALEFRGLGLRERPQTDAIGPNDYGLPNNTSEGAGYRQANIMFPAETKQSLGARQWMTATGFDFEPQIVPPNLGITTLRIPVPDLDHVLERLDAAGIPLAQPQHILFLEPYGAVRAVMVKSPGGSGQLITLFEPGAKPMTEAELKAFFNPGRFGEWVRFNRLMEGTIHYKAGGNATVTWETGLNEDGIWVIKGDAICTSWYRLRDFRELCVQHYNLGTDTTQSFRVGAGPDGTTKFRAPDTP